MAYFGHHLLIDSYGSPADLLWNQELVESFVLKCIETAEMTLINGPFTQNYSGKEPLDSGVSCVAVLAESHCTIHTFPLRNGYLSWDIYSCNTFDTTKLVALVYETFKPKSVKFQKLERGEDFPR
jgi:S-adenosylmethionine decarboxylase